jgi:hypothetical protein
MVLRDIGLAPVMSPGLFCLSGCDARPALFRYAVATSRLLVLACKILVSILPGRVAAAAHDRVQRKPRERPRAPPRHARQSAIAGVT